MDEAVRTAVDHVIPVVDAIGAFVIAVGVAIAFGLWLVGELRLRPVDYEGVRLVLGRFLALALEFQLGADILGTAVSPSWNEIGKLGAIAGIRTVLNYFLAQDLDKARQANGASDDGGGAPGALSAARRVLSGQRT